MTLERSFLGIPLVRWLALAAALAFLIALSWLIRDAFELEWSVSSLRASIEAAGIWAPILFVGLLMFRFAVLIPSSILLTGAGVCFGPVAGTIYATIGLTLSALLKFAFASIVGRDFLLRQLPPYVRENWAIGDRRTTAMGLGLICAYPFGPKHVFQIAAILAGISFGRYLLAVSIGAGFRAAAFSFFGGSIATGEKVVLASLLLVTVATVPLMVPSWRRWLFAQPDLPDESARKEAI